MRRSLVVLWTVILTLALSFPPRLIAEEKDEARIFMPEITWDFGRIPQGSVVSHAYWIKNAGTDTLKILRVKTSCGCTKAPLDKRELAPGDSTKVELIYSAGRHKGRVGKSADITSNDTTISKVRISFNGELVANFDSTSPITISPSMVDFGESREQGKGQDGVKIRNVSTKEVKVAVLDYPRDFMKIELAHNKIGPGEEVELEVNLNKDLKEEEFKKSITLEAKGENISRFSIPLLR